MNKKEYLSILNQIALNYDAEYVNECHDDFCVSMRNNIKQLENLIKEHFDNPPLKFEEIEDLDILWHNKREEYIKVTSKFINKIGKETICFVYFGSDYEDYDYFEEGMFYRKEVK